MSLLSELLTRLPRQSAVLVEVASAQGSVPRGVGTWMAVFAGHGGDNVIGTIGGGRLEFDAIAEARRQCALASEAPETRGQGASVVGPTTSAHSASLQRYALGPSLGQCCGGVVVLRYQPIGAADVAALVQRLQTPRRPVALFGGGHVGRALARALEPLPFALRWIDSRDEIFPADVPPDIVCEHSEPVHGAVPDLAPGSLVLVMSFSHAEDLDVVAACLRRQTERGDLGFIGLIGSRTKWATFRSRLEARGFGPDALAQVTCPIGMPGIAGKEPAVIAASVAAQLLQIPPPGT